MLSDCKVQYPSAQRGEIYVYGRFEDSIRFQIAEKNKVPIKTENGIEMQIV